MTSFPSLTGKDLLLALKKAVFLIVRVRGSHYFVQHPDGQGTKRTGYAPHAQGAVRYAHHTLRLEIQTSTA